MAKEYDHRIDQARWDPPARFDHAFDGEMILKQVPPEQVRKGCLAIGITPQTDKPRGCANTIDGKGYVVTIDRPCYGTTPEAVLRHEIGHLNGWPADHSD